MFGVADNGGYPVKVIYQDMDGKKQVGGRVFSQAALLWWRIGPMPILSAHGECDKEDVLWKSLKWYTYVSISFDWLLAATTV